MLASFLPLAPASAGSTKTVVATGSVTCTQISGTITYHPAEHHVGTTTESQVLTFHAGDCTTKGSNVHHVTGGSLTVVMHRPSNSCLDLLASEASTGTGFWTPKSVAATKGAFSGYTIVVNAQGDAGFSIPNTGGTAKLSGSFAGKNHGATSRATVYTNMTAVQFIKACKSSAGLSTQKILGGTATFS